MQQVRMFVTSDGQAFHRLTDASEHAGRRYSQELKSTVLALCEGQGKYIETEKIVESLLLTDRFQRLMALHKDLEVKYLPEED